VTIHKENQAIWVLDDEKNRTGLREEAARFLEENPTENTMQHLIQALTDDDFGVRWAASSALSKWGDRALPALLQVMIKDTSPRLRESAYHVLHYNQDQ
jgi:HEAT repeat protein